MTLGSDPAPRGTAVCSREGKYKQTRTEARKLVKRLEKREKQKMNAYLCRTCGTWHVGKVGLPR